MTQPQADAAPSDDDDGDDDEGDVSRPLVTEPQAVAARCGSHAGVPRPSVTEPRAVAASSGDDDGDDDERVERDERPIEVRPPATEERPAPGGRPGGVDQPPPHAGRPAEPPSHPGGTAEPPPHTGGTAEPPSHTGGTAEMPSHPGGPAAPALWGTDFEDGDLSVYKAVRAEGSGLAGSHQISTAVARTGRCSMKITVPAPTSTGSSDVGRYQLVADMPDGTNGEDRWYGFSLYYDSGWSPSEMVDNRSYFFGGIGFRYTGTADNGPGSNINAGGAGGGMSLVTGTNLSSDVGTDHVGENDLGPFETGRWIDVVLHIRWSTGQDGLREAWRDGVPEGRYAGPTLGLDSPFEHRIGIYEGVEVSQTRTLYVDNHRVGTSYAAVDPSR